ncbi:hypothetical protein SASPL_101420 [Salvia splendens]|uniref:Cytochrome P450 n=1 Tax=Salvia splendens TaxID=180675 RepID=A0A8X8YQU9_SALSN|nr:hypothetical protein SASPL_101420 [Salvia splendens]
MHLKLGETDPVVVSSPEIAKQILKDQDPCVANRPQGVALEIMWYNYIDIAFSPYGDYWRQTRKICINELLSPRMKIFSFTSSITCRAAFGGLCKDKGTLIKMRVKMMRRKLDFILDDLIDEHKSNLAKMAGDINSGRRLGNGEYGGEDLIDVLLRMKEGEELKFPIDNDNIKAVL